MNYPEQSNRNVSVQAGPYSTGGIGPVSAIQAQSPTSAAQEALGYLREMEGVMAELRRRLYGPFPESAENAAKSPHEPALDELAREICQRSAMAVGELKSILGRL